MSEVKIPLLVNGNYAVVSLWVSDHSGLSDEDVQVALSTVTDDVKADLRRRIEVAE